MPLPFALDHVNLWLLRDGEAWTAVDTGVATDAIKEAWRRLLPAHPLQRLIVTHCHPDHLGLAAWLQQETGVPLCMSQGDYHGRSWCTTRSDPIASSGMLDFFRRHGLGEEPLNALAERGNAFRKGVPDLPTTFRRIRDGDDIAVGGRDWRVIAGFGHSPEHCSLYCAALGVLISGDMLLPKISTNVAVMSQMPDDDPLGQFLDSIDRLTRAARRHPGAALARPAVPRPPQPRRRAAGASSPSAAPPCSPPAPRRRRVAELIPVVFERPISDPHQMHVRHGRGHRPPNYLEHRHQVRRSEENGITRFVQN